MLNGVTQLNMTKADVLSNFKEIKACTHYKYNGETIDYFPYDVDPELVQPIFKTIKGWDNDLTGMSSIDEIPTELNDYITFLEAELKTPITIVSVGPDRTQTLHRTAVLA